MSVCVCFPTLVSFSLFAASLGPPPVIPLACGCALPCTPWGCPGFASLCVHQRHLVSGTFASHPKLCPLLMFVRRRSLMAPLVSVSFQPPQHWRSREDIREGEGRTWWTLCMLGHHAQSSRSVQWSLALGSRSGHPGSLVTVAVAGLVLQSAVP